MSKRSSGLKILFLDIETSPNKVYVWSFWNQNISLNQVVEPGYTLCWAAKWRGSNKIMFHSLQRSSNKKMITEIHKLLEEADVVVHYHGSHFDIPVLNKEFILLGADPPAGYKEIDLLKVVRSRFRFSSNKLDFVAQSLGVGAKVKHKGMDLWRGCMDGDASSWRTMEKYNKQDVRILEKVYDKVLPWIKGHPNYGIYTDTDRPICRNCGSSKVKKKGLEYLQVGVYQRYKCTDCGAPLRGSILQNSLEDRRRLLR